MESFLGFKAVYGLGGFRVSECLGFRTLSGLGFRGFWGLGDFRA